MGGTAPVGPLRRGACVALALFAALGCRGPDALVVAAALLPGELPVYRSVIAEFERASGVEVVVVPQQYADIRRALAAEAVGGRRGTLDLVELDVYSLALARHHAALLAENEIPEIASLQPEAVAAGRRDGLRFLPQRVSWQALIYDHAVLGSPPGTWEELLETARAHSRKVALKASRYEGLTCDVLPFVWAAGGSGSTFDDAGARAAFRFFAELAPHLHPQSAIFKEATIAEAMARGELVLHVNWPFAMSLFASQGLAPDRIRSAPLPEGPAGRATVLGGGYLAVPASAPHPERAVRLARHLLGRDAQERFHRELGWFSPRRDLDPAERSGLLEGFAAMRDDVRPRPERDDYPRLSALWQQAFRRVAFEAADPAAALDEAARAWAEVRR